MTSGGRHAAPGPESPAVMVGFTHAAKCVCYYHQMLQPRTVSLMPHAAHGMRNAANAG